ncbi:alcohol dehydrogenase [Aspergillus sclerotialis]|uniref:Alcohol dehydrogenase n=1 Tax=Aspergillus sclerotialis TaxID=2070753 RepID=A0A3A2ZQF0_9EURO|nr:alcohol dehydrogenase [Aspergillus sclerotialis]
MNSTIPAKNIPTKALVVESPKRPFVLKDVILDEVRPDEVLVEMKYTGLCHTDIVVQEGAIPVGIYPAVLGHEGAGTVRRVGSNVQDKSLKEGDTVLLSFSSCQNCSTCKENRNGACSRMTDINFGGARGLEPSSSPISLPDGTPVRGQFFGQSSLSKLAVVSERSIVKCDASPEDLPFLAPLGCGYLTGAGTVFNILRPKKDSKFVIFGMGAVGLAACLAAKAEGVEIIVAVDIVDEKLELAKSLGATHSINTKITPDLEAGLREFFPDGVDRVLDTTGVRILQQSGLNALAHEGILAIVGVSRPGNTIEIDPLKFMMNCNRVIGMIEGEANPAQIVPRLVQLYRDGKFPVDRLSKIYPAGAIDQALEELHSGKVIKPVISWEDVQ